MIVPPSPTDLSPLASTVLWFAMLVLVYLNCNAIGRWWADRIWRTDP